MIHWPEATRRHAEQVEATVREDSSHLCLRYRGRHHGRGLGVFDSSRVVSSAKARYYFFGSGASRVVSKTL